VSRAIGGVASTVGWNKPTNLDKNCPFINVPAKGYTNVDGIDLSSKLGAMPDNGLTYDGGIFSTEVDEMDITYVASKSCIFRSAIPWDLNSAVGANLHHNAVAPGLTLGTTVLSPTTVAYVASMFQQWRGTIRYRLAAAKTAFHTGRLRITYHPGVYGSGALTGTVSENAYNWILDLSVSSELEFEVPYVSNVPWKEVFLGTHDNANWDLERYSTGTITITVLNELRRASTAVADNVPLNMWISGGSDIAFAMPDFARFTIAEPLTVRGDVQEEQDEVGWKAQVFNLTSSAIEHNEQIHDTSSTVFPMSKMDHTMAEQLCIGEKITSLRQLIKRFGLTSIGKPFPYRDVNGLRYTFPGPIPLNTDSYLFNKIQIDPAYFGESSATGSVQWQNIVYPVEKLEDGTLVDSVFDAVAQIPARCPLYYISYLYRFWRGSRRYKFATPTTNGLRSTNLGSRQATYADQNRSKYVQAIDGFEYDAIRPSDPLIVRRSTNIDENGSLAKPVLGTFTSTQTSSTFEHYVYPDLNGTIEFEVPYYAQTPISLVGEGVISGVDGPIIRRSKVDIMRSLDARGLDRPIYTYHNNTSYPQSAGTEPDLGGVRNCFGAYTLYEAAGDDFSFGYLIGAPRIRRVAHI
jgi:hypothetical protein